MDPMTFHEYLLAVGEKLLADKLHDYNKIEPLTELIHNKLINHRQLKYQNCGNQFHIN